MRHQSPFYWQQGVFRHQSFFTGARRVFDTRALRFAPCVKHITESVFNGSKRVFDTRQLRFATCVKHITERAKPESYKHLPNPGSGIPYEKWAIQPSPGNQSPFTGNKKVFDNRAPLLATGGFSTPEPVLLAKRTVFDTRAPSLATGGFSTPEPLYLQQESFRRKSPFTGQGCLPH